MSDLESTAIERLRAASEMSLQYYQQPLVVTTSGGKDSAVCLALAERSGIPFEVLHNHTTVDAPETVYQIRKDFRRLELKGIKCTVEYPTYKGKRVSMWSLIPQKQIPPTRMVRYCCQIMKEGGGKNRFLATGVRWAESTKRQSRGMYETMHSDKAKKVVLNNDNDDRRMLFEACAPKAKRVCNPIIDWQDSDVWNYINAENLDVNPLYDCGFSRVGCVGCPMATTAGRYKEFAKWPKFQDNYIRAFDHMLDARRSKGLDTDWQNGVEVFNWWMENNIMPGQMEIDDDYEIID